MRLVPKIALDNPYQAMDVVVRVLETAPEEVQKFWIMRFQKEVKECAKAEDLGADNPILKMPADVLPITLEAYNKLKAKANKSPANNAAYKSLSTSIREKLDAGLGEKLVKFYRELERDQARPALNANYKYSITGLAAILMTYGARIEPDDISYFRQLVPDLACFPEYACPHIDFHFRLPGKKQFLTALENYQSGTMRSFTQSSCHACGKVNDDIKTEGKQLMKCGACQNQYNKGWFCDRECQRRCWKTHKKNCAGTGDGVGIGVFTAFHDNNNVMLPFRGDIV